MLKYYFLGIVIVSLQCYLQGQNNGKEVFDPRYLHEVRIYFDEPDFFDTMVYNYDSFYGEDIPYLLGSIEIDGQVVDSIGARFKGFTSYIDGILKKPIKIDFNEFMASNSPASGIADSEGEYDDWIEFYNNTEKSISLKGFYLTDDLWRPKKWSFPENALIGPGEYLIVWADEDQGDDGLHCNFKLNKEGEVIALINEEGVIQESIIFGEQTTNIAFARNPNGKGSFIFQEPTFNSNNSPTSVATFDNEEAIIIYPNPATNEININFPDLPGLDEGSLGIYNVWGSLVLWEDINDNKLNIDISYLDTGLYFIKIQTSTSIFYTGKLEKLGF